MKVAELFVDILPDMGGFQGTLNKALTTAESKASVEVGVTADVKSLASDISKAAKKAEPAAVKVPVEIDEESSNRAIGVVDTLGSRAGIAAGGIGDLAGALEAQGIISEQMAGAMETAAATVQGFAGVADLALISTEGLKAAKASLAAADIKATASAAASKAATVAMTAVTWLQTAAMGALNAVMSLNPFALVVIAITALVAAFVVLFNKNQAFHDLVIKVWDAIKSAIAGAWNNFIKPAFDAIWKFIQDTLIPLFQKLWDTVKSVFDKIAAIVSWLWDTVIKPVFNLWWSYITDVLIPIIMKLWDFIKAAFDKIADIIQWVWENVIKKVFNAIKNIITDVVIPIFQKVWDFIKKAFDGVGTAIQWVWENVIKKAFDAIKTGVDTVKSGFQTAVDGIKTIWDGLKKIAAVPVNFLIETVWNNGLMKLINLIPGVPDLSPLSPIKFARGGVLPGYTPGRDTHQFFSPTGGNLALSGGEAIMRPEWVRAMGGEKAINRMNKLARRGIYDEYASGGIYRPTANGSYLGAIHPFNAVDVGVPVGTAVHAGHGGRATAYDIKGYEPRVSHGGLGFRSYGRVVKIVGEGRTSLYAHLSKRINSGVVAGGEKIGESGNTGNSHGPHLHFEATNPGPHSYSTASRNYSGGGSMSDGGGEDEGGHWWDKALDLIRKVKDALGSNLSNAFFNIKEIGKSIGNNIVDFANGKIPFFDPIPHFADGGVVKRPTIGLLGEKGPEAVVPLGRGGSAMNRGPAVMIQNYNVYGDTDVDALMTKAEFYVRAGRV